MIPSETNTRRSFLRSLIAGGLTAAADPEKLLWVPGQKLISIPGPVAMGVYGTPFYNAALLELLEGKFTFRDLKRKRTLERAKGDTLIWRPYHDR